jgi:hypothetical protein
MADFYPFYQRLLDGIKAGEIPIISTGRQMGKSYVNTLLQNFYASMREQYKPKIKWQRLPGLKIQAYTDDVAPRGFERGLNESDMDPVQAWTEECHCGTRMSFNVWKFTSEKQITMFLIKWSE